MTQKECLDYLDELTIVYDLIKHPAVFTIEEAMAEPKLKGRDEIKNLFIQDDKGKRQYLVVMQGLKKLNLNQLAEDLGEKKIRFCSTEKVEQMLGVKPGSVSLFCCLNPSSYHVKVILDNELLNMQECGLHPIVNTSTVFLSPADLHRLVKSFEQESHFLPL